MSGEFGPLPFPEERKEILRTPETTSEQYPVDAPDISPADADYYAEQAARAQYPDSSLGSPEFVDAFYRARQELTDN